MQTAIEAALAGGACAEIADLIREVEAALESATSLLVAAWIIPSRRILWLCAGGIGTYTASHPEGSYF
jgi:hypothetical protein